MTSIARSAIPILAVVAILGSAVYSLVAPTADPVLAPYAGKSAVVEGVVVRDPDIREKTIRLTVEPDLINGITISGSKRIIVSVDRFAHVAYGDRIRAEGKLQKPEAFETDSGRTFNYPMYLWAHGVSHELPFAKIEVLATNTGNSVVAWLLSVKHTFITGIERAIPEPYAALAEGLLLGEKQSLGDKLYDAFVAAGVVHIIVLSGYNVALVISAVLYVSLRVLPRLAGYAVAAIFVIAFAVMTGGSETTIRATVMALLMMMARVLHRPAAALRGLMIAAAAMALWNPFLVLYDLSFQLSVLATLGLILFSDSIAKRLAFIPEKFGFREIVATTLATQITVLPLLILSIGAVSLVFLPANALILAPIPLAMLFSFTAALVALALPALVPMIAFPAYLILAYIITVAEFFGTLPFALVQVPPTLTWWLLGILTILYSFVLLRLSLRQTIDIKS